MPRCNVPGCESGTFKDVRKSKATGSRVKSFFSFPKNKEARSKWKGILFKDNEEITDKYKICELHFKQSDIIKCDETVLKDGTIHRIPRQRYLLRRDAIPILSANEDSNSVKDSLGDIIDHNYPRTAMIQNELIDTVHKQGNAIEKQRKKQLAKQQMRIEGEIASIPLLSPKKTNNFKNGINISDTTRVYPRPVIHKTTKPSVTTYLHDEKNIMIKLSNQDEGDTHLSLSKEEIGSDNTCYQLTYDEFYKNIEVEFDTPTQKDSIERIIIKEEACEDEPDYCLLQYSFNQLRSDLECKRLPISSSWSYFFQGDISITLAYVHPLKCAIQVLCTIDINMNVEVATSDKRVSVQDDIKFDSRDDFLNYLSKLEKMKCCDGTGIRNIFSKQCQGFISINDEYQRCRGYQRCNFCREWRKVIQKKEEKMINVELKIREQHHKIKALQFKNAQLLKLLYQKHQ